MNLFLILLFAAIIKSSVFGDFPLTILHTNDVHARFVSFNDRQRPCEPADLASNKCWGGAARRQTAIKKYRKEHPNVLALDAGDQFQGTLWYTALKWTPIAQYMNIIKYDAMSFGNHEFDDGLSGLEPFIRNLSTPIINSNIEDEGSPIKDLFQRKIIKEVGGQKIGIVGCTTIETPNLANPGPKLEFHPEIASIQLQVDELIKSGVNKIIVLSHAGIAVDRQICQKVKGVDIVVGGHSHTFLWTGKQPSNEPPEGPYPEVYSKCLVVQDYAYGKYLGRLKVQFDDLGNLKNWSGNNPVLLDSRFPEDKEIATLLSPYKSQLEHFQKTVVATTAVALDGSRRSCRLKECNLGNLLADATLYFYVKRQLASPTKNTEGWSTAAIGIYNGGGVRDYETPAGSNVTLEDLYTILPFQNTIDKITIKGVHLKEAFEHSVNGFNPSDAAGKFLQVSGVKVLYDMTKPNGQRVKRLRVRCNECGVPNYQDVDNEKIYNVVTQSYLSGGGDGFTVLRDKKLSSDASNVLDTDVVMDYVKTYKPVLIGEESRIEFDLGDGQTGSHAKLSPSSTSGGTEKTAPTNSTSSGSSSSSYATKKWLIKRREG